MSDDVDELFDRAKSRYRQEDEKKQERIRRDESYAYDWTQYVIGWLAGIVSVFGAVFGSCCFLSSAVCEHLGLPDDCYYLRRLRAYRDEYLLKSNDPNRVSAVFEYYVKAPRVLSWISHQDSLARAQLWLQIATSVEEAVLAIESGSNEHAFDIYQRLVAGLFKESQCRNGDSSAHL